MLPTLKSGQVVLVVRTRKISVGQVAVAFMRGREVIKRIVDIKKGQVYMHGDNAESSTDSRTLGPIPDTKVEGIVIWPNTQLKR